MSNIVQKSCRICLKSSDYYDIADSTCYVKIFIQVTGINDFSDKLWLCIWCKATLKRTISLVKLASKTVLEPASKENINLYNLSYTHNPHIDIPPSNIQQLDKHADYLNDIDSRIQESGDSNMCQESNIITSYHESNDLKIHQELNHSVIQEADNSILEESLPIKSEHRKKLNYAQLKFEMKHLNSDEQFNELELKKLKNRHMKFMCDYCGAGFLTVDLFDAHKLRHSEAVGPHICRVCQLRFRSPDVLSQHLLSHKRRIRCLVCDAVFNRWSHCLTHRYKCGGGSAPAQCGHCSKIFSDAHSLAVHIKGVHQKEKTYICEQCQAGFASKQRLTVHMRSHTGLKPFTCALCPRTFTTNSNLRAHSAVHDDITRHYCVECNTHYKSSKSLKRHFEQSARHIIMNDAGYKCKECSKQFRSEKSLQHHIKVRHNTTHRCTHCNKTFSNNTNLNKHIRCLHSS